MIDTDDIACLSAEEKRVLLSRLLMEQAGMSAAVHPMSFGQRSMWFLHKLAPGSPAYTITFAGRIRGDVDVPALERAVQALVDRHPVLRTTYGVRDGEPVQLVHPQWPVQITHHVAAAGEELDDLLHREAHRPFDLETGPVLRVTLSRTPTGEHVLVLSVHHIAVDFWAIDVMLDELRRLYAAERGGASPPRPSGSYTDFVDRQLRMAAGAVGENHWEYWREQLAGDLPVLRLPTDRPARTLQTYRGAVHRFTLDAVRTARLKDVGRQAGATPFVTVLTAYATLLHRYSGQDSVCIGSPFACRDEASLENVVGYVANPVVLRTDTHGDPSFTTMLGRVRDTVLGALTHQDYPFPLLVDRLRPTRDPGHSPLFQTSFAWEQARRFDNVLGGPSATGAALDLETLHIGQGGAPLELMLLAGESNGELSFAFQYNTDLFDEATVERMAGHLRTLLDGIADHPHAALSELPLLTAEERREHAEWNDTATVYDAPAHLHELVAETVRRMPDEVAVTYADRDVTYRELDARATSLAQRLRTLGVVPGSLVPVVLERSLDLVVALLGVLKAGGAFMPVDPAQPVHRTEALLAEVLDPAVCITHERHLEHVAGFAGHRLCLDVPAPAPVDGAEIPGGAGPADLAYVVHTSGSTGRPKGALNTHAGICNRLLWMQDTYRLTADDRVLHKTPVTFDAAVLEIFWPLTAGARLVIAEPEGHKDPGYLVRTVLEQGITTLFFVPSLLRSFLAEPAASDCLGLRRVFSAGEVLPQDLVVRVLATLNAALYNEYGPAEASVGVTYHDCRRGAGASTVPIGRPIANTRVHILDSHLKPVPVGVPGELFIGGVAVGRGYLNRPEATAAAFVADPFTDVPGQLLYRTGDLGRHLPGGDIEYLGRRDDQVKIRGVRIEPGEIEAALNEHPAVADNAVVAVDDGRGTPMLVAHITTTTPEQPPTTTELRRFLHGRLPSAMLPAVYRIVEALPRTSSGKVDRKTLAAPDNAPPAEQVPFVAPTTRAEKILADIWSEVLGHERVGVHDDFFALGGSSSHSLEVSVRAQQAGLPLTPESVFLCGTIAELADAYAPSAADTDEVAPTAVERTNTVIESLGTYLPPTVLTTAEVVDHCATPVGIPLERLTGIRSRRSAGDGEFAIDLARQAATDCLMHSTYVPEEIDLLICCNVSRCDGPGQKFVFEPSTAARLRDLCGLVNATAFDISNACAGMFTGISVADAFLQTGQIRNAMVVSGEYITQLTETAQKEISGPMDPRLACLTLGDAGAAVILERGDDRRTGFHDIELATLGRYSSLCVGKATDQPHGGAIMVCDSISGTAVAVKRTVPFVAAVMRRHGWRPEHCDHIVMHQTSEASIHDGVSAINKLFGQVVAHPGNTIVNLAERGNTASTTHFVALKDHILGNRIKSGDNVVFGITGSGQTVGAALYTFDDLPDRLRRAPDRHGPRPLPSTTSGRRPPRRPTSRVRIHGVGICAPGETTPRRSADLATAAAAECLEMSGTAATAVDVMIHTGVYREEFISEPAIAAFVAGRLGVNDDAESPDGPTTLAFDVLNGAVGFLDACQVATQLIAAGRAEHAMVMASEVENNSPDCGHPAYGVAEMGSAVLLDRSVEGDCGFGDFAFGHFPEYSGALETFSRHTNGRTWLQVDRDPDLIAHYLDAIPSVVEQLLKSEDLTNEDVGIVFAPFLPPAALTELARRIRVEPSRFLETPTGADPFTSSFPLGLQEARRRALVTPGDVGLIIAVGSGVEVGCATYHF